jgi:hypothetical protein
MEASGHAVTKVRTAIGLDTCPTSVVVSGLGDPFTVSVCGPRVRRLHGKNLHPSKCGTITTRRALMSRLHDLGEARRNGCARGLLIAVALFALLIARCVPRDLHGAAGLHRSTHSASTQDHRPRFNCETPNWSIPIGTAMPAPPDAELAYFIPAHEFLPNFSTKGFRFNRPPPAA